MADQPPSQADAAELEAALGVRFKDRRLLRLALRHPSVPNEAGGSVVASNQRLEFLGDAVLGLVTAQELYRRLPDSPEGDLTRRRAHLVQGPTLAAAARRLELGRYLHLGRGEEATGGRQRERNLAAALEAVVGAVYLDRGLRTAAVLVRRALGPELGRVVAEGVLRDPKSLLQERVQGRGLPPPTYRVLEHSGPPHRTLFVVAVEVNGEEVARGEGIGKARAEREAATAAYAALGEDGAAPDGPSTSA